MSAVVYSLGSIIGRGGIGDIAMEAVRGLHERGLLKRLLVLDGVTGLAADRTFRFPAKLVLNRVVARFLPDFLRDTLYDCWASRRIGECQVFYGWAGQALHSIRRARGQGALTLLDRGMVEVRTLKKLLDEEHQRHGLSGALLFRQEVERIRNECDEADVIVVPSKFVYDSFRDQGYSESKLWHCPLGVDTERFSPTPDSDGPFRVLFLGRIGLQKGVVYLLRAWEKLNLANAELVIMGPLGSPSERAGRAVVLKEIERMNWRGVRLAPPTDQPEKALQKVSVVVLPSVQDGFGVVVLEAMASGLPVIVSENVGAKECVREGVDGFICPAGDVGALARSIQSLYDDPSLRTKMGIHAREQALRYSWEAYRERIVAKIEALMGARCPSPFNPQAV